MLTSIYYFRYLLLSVSVGGRTPDYLPPQEVPAHSVAFRASLLLHCAKILCTKRADPFVMSRLPDKVHLQQKRSVIEWTVSLFRHVPNTSTKIVGCPGGSP